MIELKNTAEKRGHTVYIFKNGEFNLFIENGATKLFYNQKPFSVTDYDIVLNRISVREKSNAEYYVANEFIHANIPFFNTPGSIAKARNKLLSLQIMADLGVDLTRSAVVRRHEDIELLKQSIWDSKTWRSEFLLVDWDLNIEDITINIASRDKVGNIIHKNMKLFNEKVIEK